MITTQNISKHSAMKNNDDLHRWISFGKSRVNRFMCIYQKEQPRKHRNQNCTCSHKNEYQLSRRTTSNKNRNNICQRKHQHFHRKPIYIFVYSQAAIQAITEQNHKNYHDITITEIRQNLINISHKIRSIKFVYHPVHKEIFENETADKLAKIEAKKAQALEPTYTVSSSEIKTVYEKITLSKWQKRWNNTNDNKYKNIVRAISKQELKQCALHLKHNFRKRASKIIRLKSGHGKKSQKQKLIWKQHQTVIIAKSRKPPLIFSYTAKPLMVNEIN